LRRQHAPAYDAPRVIGSIVQGKYRIERLLGEGGMGSVYLARELDADRPVALKVLSAYADESGNIVERFHRESRAARSIDSPHVAQIFDAGTDGNRPFLVMEYLDGEDLSHLFKRLQHLPPRLALRIVGQACAGLARAHEVGVVHRDIKPANLFLARGEGGIVTVKVLDFGVAKVLPLWARRDVAPEVLTRTGAVLGSPLYMAPEQARGAKAVDHRADVWSMGVVLYQALAGQAPNHEIEAIGELIVTICTQAPRPVHEVAPWLSPSVAAIVTQALRLDPRERFQTAGAMLDAIRAELGEDPWLHESQLVRLADDERAHPFGSPDQIPSTVRDPGSDATIAR
jgi:eukaryotic-like serine/threonine-protein kinase